MGAGKRTTTSAAKIGVRSLDQKKDIQRLNCQYSLQKGNGLGTGNRQADAERLGTFPKEKATAGKRCEQQTLIRQPSLANRWSQDGDQPSGNVEGLTNDITPHHKSLPNGIGRRYSSTLQG